MEHRGLLVKDQSVAADAPSPSIFNSPFSILYYVTRTEALPSGRLSLPDVRG